MSLRHKKPRTFLQINIKTTKLWTLLILFLWYPLCRGQEKPKKVDVEVVVGIDLVRKLNFLPSSKIQVGNENILSYVLIPEKREIILRGLKPGTTSMTVRNQRGDAKIEFKVNITATDQSRVVKELRELIGDIEGLKIGIKGNRVYIGGHIIVPNDIGKIVVVLEKYPDVMRLVELSPQTQRVIARKMQEEIQKSGNNLKEVTVRVINGLFWLEGIVTSEGEKSRAEQIALAYIPDKIESLAKRIDAVATVKRSPIQNFIVVNAKKKSPPVAKLVKISAQFVELTKDYNKIFGFKWEPFLSNGQGSINFGKTNQGTVTTRSNNSLAGTISNLFPKLASARAAGYARVVQSGVILIKNRVQGSINKLEEKPFAIGTGEFVKSEKAVAGFNLNITPTILGREKLDLNIGLTVSATTGDPPQTLKNTIKTALVVNNRESAVAGGIVVNKTSADFDRNPPGGKQEVEGGSPLFSFVRSKSYTKTKSQFVVFVTPEIMSSASRDVQEVKRKFRQRRR